MMRRFLLSSFLVWASAIGFSAFGLDDAAIKSEQTLPKRADESAAKTKPTPVATASPSGMAAGGVTAATMAAILTAVQAMAAVAAEDIDNGTTLAGGSVRLPNPCAVNSNLPECTGFR